MYKRVIIFSIIISLFFTSCVTKKLWKNHVYQEKVKGFLLTKKGNVLVIVSEDFHYVFNIDAGLKRILLSDKRKNIKASFDTFNLDDDNNILGNYLLSYTLKNTKKNDEEIKWLKNNGFHIDNSDSNNIHYLKYAMIQGKRYLANKTIIPNGNFNFEYKINIKTSHYEKDDLTRIGLTPVSVVADTIIVAGVTAIVVLAIAGGGGGNLSGLDFGGNDNSPSVYNTKDNLEEEKE